jgi:hypothetical protein
LLRSLLELSIQTGCLPIAGAMRLQMGATANSTSYLRGFAAKSAQFGRIF